MSIKSIHSRTVRLGGLIGAVGLSIGCAGGGDAVIVGLGAGWFW
jgi:hypothetical protein